jgi:uncharacterized protein (UPF0179 family)
MSKITIVGETHAKKGLVFTYLGETDEGCKACKLHKVCHDLEPNREYAIKAVRPVKHDVCHVFEGKVQVVDVEPLPARMTIPVSSLRGSMVTKHWEECGASCLLKRFCNAPAIPEGGRAAIKEVQGDVPCLVGRKLKFAAVEPVR